MNESEFLFVKSLFTLKIENEKESLPALLRNNNNNNTFLQVEDNVRVYLEEIR